MGPGLAEELLQKHQNSTQPSSQTLCAVLRATLEVLQAEGLEATPSALFAAVMSSLERPQGYSTPEVAMALCTVLSTCLSRIPDALVRSKFVSCSQVIMTVIDHHREQAGVMRAAVGALGQVTAAMDPTDWPSASGPFNRLLGLSLDSRPKVRRVAHNAIATTLATLQALGATSQASEAILKVCQQVLPGPEAALKAATGAKKSQRQEADALLQRSISDAGHLLNLLKITLQLLAGPVMLQLAEMLPRLFVLQQPMLTRQAADALSALCGSISSGVPGKPLARLLGVVLEADAVWEAKDPNVRLSLLQLVELGLSRLHQVDASLGASLLDDAFDRLVPQLAAGQEDVRLAALAVLKNTVHDCMNGSVVGSQHEGAFASLEAALGPTHQEIWAAVLSVLEELFGGLPPEAVEHVQGLLGRVGNLSATAAEALAIDSADADTLALGKAANSALGAAIRSMGPAAVLQVLPLNLLEGRGGEARTWLLPLLRQNVANTNLAFWGDSLLPLARSLIERASVAPTSGEEGLTGLQYRALEAQIWNTLPSFCCWPTDMAQAFQKHAQGIGKAFQNREDLRAPICTALEKLCRQAQSALQAAGRTEGVGFSLPTIEENDDEDGAMNDFELDLVAPPHYTTAVAERDAAVLRQFAKNWMPLLFNAFVGAPPGERGHLGRAISAYASLADKTVLETFFKTVVKKLIRVVEESKGEGEGPDSVKEGGENSSERRCTFMELALCLTPGLSTSAVKVLYTASSPSLQEKDQAVQKRAYKLLAYILEQRKDFAAANFQDILDSLLLGVASSMSAAKRYRLRCLQAAVMILQAPDAPEVTAPQEDMADLSQSDRRKQVVAMLVSEIVLCIKEVNKRTRVAAYELLVGLARGMHEANPPPTIPDLDAQMDGGGEEDRGGLHTLFTMILGGLVGASPHMISASVMALARLLYEFVPQLETTAPQLLPVVLSLLRSKSREVIKSVLGFVKVCVIKLPVEMVQSQLGDILEGILLWSQDSKNKFRLKVRVIVERLVRRLDYETVAEHIPEADRKLLTHIRKEQQRKQRKGGQSEEGSQMDVDEAVTAKSRGGKSRAARSEWAHSRVFSSDDDEEAGGKPSSRSKASLWGDAGPPAKAPRSQVPGRKAGAVRFASNDGEEPLDLLDPSTSRAMQRTAAGRTPMEVEPDFPTQAGRMVINEEAVPNRGPKPKRKRGGGIDTAASDDSDFDDLHNIAGATAALRLGGRTHAGSVAAQSGARSGARSVGGKTLGGKTFAARTLGGKSSRSGQQGKEHSGKRFAASKRGAGGDVKGKSKVEPYAYWPLDRKMLNRRNAKKVEANRGLSEVVASAPSAKGRKAKKQKR